MNRLSYINKNLVALFGLAALTACTSGKSTDLDEIASSSRNREVIVRQADTDQPIIAKNNRAHWVDVRKKAKHPETKIYATLATGTWDAAETEARSLLQKQPNNGAALVVLATALGMQKKYALAAYYAKAYEKAHGSNAEVLNLKGLSLLTAANTRMEDYKNAAAYFEQAFQSGSSEIAAGLNLGHLYLEIGDAAAAAEIFREVKSRCGACIPSLVGSGVANSRLRNFAQAKDDFNAALKKKEHHPEALYRLAQITFIGDKDYKRAKKYIDELMTYAPENAYLVRQKAEALVRAMDAEGDPRELRPVTAIAEEGDKSEGLDAPEAKPVSFEE